MEEYKEDKLYCIVKGSTDISDNVCCDCLIELLREGPIEEGEAVREVGNDGDERYLCTYCGANLSDY